MKNAWLKGMAAGLGALVFSIGFNPGAWAATATRTSGFDYDLAGLLAKEVIEPGDSNLCLVTTYTYDSFGNKTGATTRNCNGSTYGYGSYSEAAAPTGNAVIESRTSSTGYVVRWGKANPQSTLLTEDEKERLLGLFRRAHLGDIGE